MATFVLWGWRVGAELSSAPQGASLQRSLGMLAQTHLPGSQRLSPLVPHSSGLNVLTLKRTASSKEIPSLCSIRTLP